MLGIGRGMGVPLGKGISPGQMETRGRCPSLCQLGGEQTLLAEGLWEALHKNREKNVLLGEGILWTLVFLRIGHKSWFPLGRGLGGVPWIRYFVVWPYALLQKHRGKTQTATGPSPTPTPGWGADETEGYWIGRGWGNWCTHTDETIMSIKQFLPVSCGIGREE